MWVMCACVCVFTISLNEQDVTQGHFKRSLTGLNKDFFPGLVDISWLKRKVSLTIYQ